MTALVTIAGQQFRVLGPSEHTPDRVRYLLDVLRALEDLQLPDGTLEAAAVRLMARAVESGQVPALLAGFLAAPGEAIWTPEEALRVREYLGGLTLAEGPAALVGRSETLAVLANVGFGLVLGDWPQLRNLLRTSL